ncbi:MAG TPA: hypothetical protein VM261_31600 [Kofleriaceae bacterium]|nr:hypothetical protein [Kofleriaceae bacterium]
MRSLTVAFSLTAAALVGCGTSDDDGGDDQPTGPTWYGDVAPLLAEHCMGCHREGGIGPFSMESYDVAAPIAPMMLEAVETGVMPPWDAESSDECAPRHGWKDDTRLTATQIQLLRDWIAAGTPAGTAAEIPDPPSLSLDAVTHTVAPSVPYATSGDNDEFICFLLDPGIARQSWLTGLEVVPDNEKVVHHVVLMGFTPGDALTAEINAHGVGQPFDCSGSVITQTDTFLMGVWTPGSQPFETPANLGLPVPARSHILMQMHYHPGGTTNAPDASTVNLRLQTTRPINTYTIGAVGNAAAAPTLLPDPDDRGAAEFRIPAGATDHVESMRFPLSLGAGRFRLFAAYPHMHYIGVELSVQIEHPLPGGGVDRECLVNVPRWNFDWQRTYQYDAPMADLPALQNGDTLVVRCSYDNSLGNPFVRRALEEMGLQEPIDVLLGEESLDEMCLGIFGVVVEPAP